MWHLKSIGYTGIPFHLLPQWTPQGTHHVMSITGCMCSHGDDILPLYCSPFETKVSLSVCCMHVIKLTCIQHTLWSREKLGNGTEDPKPMQVWIYSIFIGLMNDYLLQHSEQWSRAEAIHVHQLCLANEVFWSPSRIETGTHQVNPPLLKWRR